MALWDIVTLVVLGLGLLYGIWKGFFKIILRGGALFLAIIVSRPIGNFITERFIFGLFSGNSFEAILEAGSSIIVSVIVFVLVFFIFKLLAGLLAKALNKVLSSSKIDRFLGAILGLLVGGGFMFLIATAVSFIAAVVANLGLSVAWLDLGGTFLFRFFL